ncbi:MAG: Lrp/AsnC family transcriptional regulator [Thermoanaerobaculia bacterium]|nr:Lrp/AsnC family transcriptional regulator [Thermoanaerobaculia bacterium]
MAKTFEIAPPPPEPTPVDEMDAKVLRLLQENGRMTNRSIAEQVSISPPGLQKRLRRLEQKGVIRRYAALVDREAVGLDLLCFVQVTLAHHQPNQRSAFRDTIQSLPEVLECHHLTGEYDYLLKVVVRNQKELERFLFERLTPIEGVDRVRTSIVLREIKNSTSLPLEATA